MVDYDSLSSFAYDAFNKDNPIWVWIFIAVAILFNPIVSIYFQRSTWRVIDIVTGIIFLVSIQTIKNK